MKYIPLLVAVVLALTIPALPIQSAEPCEALPPDTQSVEIATLPELPEPVALEYYIVERIPGPKPCYPLRDWERKLIERVLMSECPYEPSEGQQAVAQVILDRLMSDEFPETVYEVLTQDNQFAGPSDAEVLPEVAEAVNAVFDRGERVSEEPIYWFYAPKYGWSGFHERQEHITTIGGHKFYSARSDAE